MKGTRAELVIDELAQLGLALVVLILSAMLMVRRLWQRRQISMRAPGRHQGGRLPPVLVSGGSWWYPVDHLPHPGVRFHSYFRSPQQGALLAKSLVQSGGQQALLSAAWFRVAIFRKSWAGLRIASVDAESARELSSGSGSMPTRIVRICNACVALQRNDTNYGHFITEVLPSILAWEASSLFPCRLVVAQSSFAVPLLNMIGFKGTVEEVPSPALLLATNVTVLRLLPAGIYHSALLREVARRAHISAADSPMYPRCREVVFLTRTASATRRLTNETEVIAAIREVFPDVDVFYSGEATVVEQVARMARARVVISTFGAQAMNMVWATAIEHFVEISFYSKNQRCFTALAQSLGASAHSVASRPLRASDHYSDHECDLGNLAEILKNIRVQTDGLDG